MVLATRPGSKGTAWFSDISSVGVDPGTPVGAGWRNPDHRVTFQELMSYSHPWLYTKKDTKPPPNSLSAQTELLCRRSVSWTDGPSWGRLANLVTRIILEVTLGHHQRFGVGAGRAPTPHTPRPGFGFPPVSPPSTFAARRDPALWAAQAPPSSCLSEARGPPGPHLCTAQRGAGSGRGLGVVGAVAAGRLPGVGAAPAGGRAAAGTPRWRVRMPAGWCWSPSRCSGPWLPSSPGQTSPPSPSRHPSARTPACPAAPSPGDTCVGSPSPAPSRMAPTTPVPVLSHRLGWHPPLEPGWHPSEEPNSRFRGRVAFCAMGPGDAGVSLLLRNISDPDFGNYSCYVAGDTATAPQLLCSLVLQPTVAEVPKNAEPDMIMMVCLLTAAFAVVAIGVLVCCHCRRRYCRGRAQEAGAGAGGGGGGGGTVALGDLKGLSA
ncbi:uncharacterized protein LOC128143597 [Harpia harpyja]|uniref:uncharacterized protein LOC128143597 n=1 Tax=Harpia harpyja TaxID=202280 RepID=UPI0022B1B03C|nr:uncharacterized protein LOC128143597 [Harpia harpyja]